MLKVLGFGMIRVQSSGVQVLEVRVYGLEVCSSFAELPEKNITENMGSFLTKP